MRRHLLLILPLLALAGLIAGCGPKAVRSDSGSSRPLVQRAPVVPPTVKTQKPAELVNPWKPEKGKRDWRHIVIHHTASSRDSVESINQAHLKRGWEGVGYHFVIGNGNGMADGEIEPTFRWKTQMHGAHAGNEEYNQHGIGICLVGNFEDTHPSAAQLAAVKRLVGVLKTQYEIKSANVVGHKTVKSTACPGKHFPLTEVSQSEVLPFVVGGAEATELHLLAVEGSQAR